MAAPTTTERKATMAKGTIPTPFVGASGPVKVTKEERDELVRLGVPFDQADDTESGTETKEDAS